jgi:hypothetical protein
MTPATDTIRLPSKRPSMRSAREDAATAPVDILEALVEALTTGERYRFVERDGELHIVEQSE